MTYEIGFGTAWQRDGHGILGKGSIEIRDGSFELMGNARPSILSIVIVFVVGFAIVRELTTNAIDAMIEPLVTLGGASVAAVVWNFAARGPLSTKGKTKSITELTRSGKVITFKPETSSKGNHVLTAKSEDQALAIEEALRA